MIEYFTHDLHSRNDPKLVKIEMKLGKGARMTFWDLVEMLYENGGKLMLSECDSYAFALRTECELIMNLVNNFDVFQVSECGTYFYSNSVNKRLAVREEKSKKAQNSANSRWKKPAENKGDNANAMRTHSEGNAIKEKKKKEKEIKDKINNNKSIEEGDAGKPQPSPEIVKKFSAPTIEMCIDYFAEKMAVGWNIDFAESQGEKFWHFYESKGWMIGKNKMKSWHSAVSTWIKGTTKADEQKFLNKGQNNGQQNRQHKPPITTETLAPYAESWARKIEEQRARREMANSQ